MAKKIKVNLSQSSINDAIKKLTDIKNVIGKNKDDILKDLAEQTKDKIEEYYDKLQFTSNDRPTFAVVKYGNGYKAVARGKSVIYDEFGTGDKGQADGHPWKGEFGLNAYNSGKTIRPVAKYLSKDKQAETGITSGMYWTYKDEAGTIHYTQGIPSGKFMYNADIWLRNNYKEIVKKKVDDVLSKV